MPINLEMKFNKELDPKKIVPKAEHLSHILTLGLVYREKKFTESILVANFLTIDTVMIIILICVIQILSFLLTCFVANKQAICVIHPLRKLN